MCTSRARLWPEGGKAGVLPPVWNSGATGTRESTVVRRSPHLIAWWGTQVHNNKLAFTVSRCSDGDATVLELPNMQPVESSSLNVDTLWHAS